MARLSPFFRSPTAAGRALVTGRHKRDNLHQPQWLAVARRTCRLSPPKTPCNPWVCWGEKDIFARILLELADQMLDLAAMHELV